MQFHARGNRTATSESIGPFTSPLMSDIAVSDKSMREEDFRMTSATIKEYGKSEYSQRSSRLHLSDQVEQEAVRQSVFTTKASLVSLGNQHLLDWLGILGPLVVAGVVWACGEGIDPNPGVARCAGVIIIVCGWWVCAPFPDIAASIAPVVFLPLVGVLSAEDAASTYFSDNIFLLIGAGFSNLCIEESGLSDRLGLQGLKQFTGSTGNVRPAVMVLGFAVVAGGLSMVCHNTSTTLMMLPFALGIIEKVEESNRDRPEDCRCFSVAVMLAIAYSASMGGIATSIGTSANLVVISTMTSFFGAEHSLTFADYLVYMGVPALAMLCLVYAVVCGFWLRGVELSVPPQVVDTLIAAKGPWDRDQKAVLCVQLVMIVLWISREASWGWGQLMLDGGEFWGDGAVAVAAALPLFSIPSVQRPGEALLTGKMIEHFKWSVCLLLGGGFALAEGVQASGLDAFIAGKLSSPAQSLPLFAFLVVLVFGVTCFTEFASNTATANILLPILAATAVKADLHPLALLLPVAAACSCAFCLPMATVPNALIFSTKRVGFREMIGTGFILNALAAVVIPLAMCAYTLPVAGAGGFGGSHAPSWAEDLAEATGKLVNCTFTSPAPTPGAPPDFAHQPLLG